MAKGLGTKFSKFTKMEQAIHTLARRKDIHAVLAS